jgi:gamma-glutamylcyclotransferase (GGCT)/AIG2-like uncharacterized protein YtfP
MPTQSDEYLFVYGTLRKGLNHPMHRVLEQNGTYLGVGVFQGRLYNLGLYPGAVASTDKSAQVIGELYKLERNRQALDRLDNYEGRLFARRRVSILLDTRDTIPAWIYLYCGEVEESRRIPSGDYLAYLNGG